MIRNGLAIGERVCVSRLDVMVEGMRMRPVEAEPEAAAGSCGNDPHLPDPMIEEVQPTHLQAVAAAEPESAARMPRPAAGCGPRRS